MDDRNESAPRATSFSFTEAFAGSFEPVLLCDAQGNVVEANPAFFALLGLEAGAGTGPLNLLDDLLHPLDRATFSRLLNSKDPAAGSFRLRNAGGNSCEMDARVAKLDCPQQSLYLVHLRARLHETKFHALLQKRTKKALSTLESIYRATMDAIVDMIALVDRDLRVLVTNRRVANWLANRGFRGSLVGEKVTALLSFCDEDDFRQVLRTGRPLSKMVRLVEGGGEFFFDLELTPIFEKGAATRVLFVGRDVTAKKKVEEALRDSEQRFRSLVEQAEIGVYLLENGRVTYVNGAMEKITGYSRQEIRSWRMESFQEAAKRAGESTEWKIVTKSGGTRYVQHSFNVLGGLIVGTLTDVTDRRLMLEKISESEQKFRALAEQSLLAMVILEGGTLSLSFANKKAEQLTGYSVEEMNAWVGGDLLARVHPDDRSQAVVDLERVLRGSEVRNECRIHHKSGKLLWVRYFARLVNLESDRKLVYMALLDVSLEKSLEEELVKVQKLESLGVLAGGIAHDFNNLLQSVQGNLSLLEKEIRGEGTSDLHELLSDASNALTRARRLTAQLLTFAKGGEPVKRVQSIKGFLEESAKFALRGMPAKLVLDVADNLLPVNIDASQIQQVLHNLLINAVQAMPHGGRVTVAARNAPADAVTGLPLPPDKEYVEVSVTDEGVGIEPEVLPRVFDPYFTTKPSGNGLGLTVVFSIVKKHGGHVTVRSEPGRGSTFAFYLPAVRSIPEPERRETLEAPKLRRGGRILVVDDQASIRKVLKRSLEYLGFQAVCAPDGAKALELVESTRRNFVAAILDLTMPGSMGGKELAWRLKQFAPNLPLIVTSGYSEDPVLTRYEQHGFDGYLAKPFSLDQLREELDRVLDAATRHGSSGRAVQ
ncbi:MAG: hypothetical protein Kow0069_14450 [Promethearchaeota archaeon]